MNNLMKWGRLWVREGTTDIDLAMGIDREYHWLNPAPGDTILDVGACFGAFADWANAKGARVIAVEPMPENCTLLRKNAPYAKIIQAAVVSTVDCTPAEVKLYLSNSASMGSHTLKPTRGRMPITVPAVPLTDLLSRHTPNKLKVDCEGEEYALFQSLAIPPFVTHIVLELHLNKRRTDRENARLLDQNMRRQGFLATCPPVIGEKNWHTIAAYERKAQ